jgi:Ca2+-binding RTX toxin-like protein
MIYDIPMLTRPTEHKDGNNNTNKMQLFSFLGISILCFTFSTAASVGILSSDNNILALTRGTVYDDLLISNKSKGINNQTDQMGVARATAIQGSQDSVSEFIYGDYGNDEIQGSSSSDHLNGGPGNDVIYGNDGGDYIQGGLGIDSLYGGDGNDVLSGGEGADYFDCGPGRDSIDDFNSTEGDFALSNCEIIENEGRPSR